MLHLSSIFWHFAVEAKEDAICNFEAPASAQADTIPS